jgi:hypothetical protein
MRPTIFHFGNPCVLIMLIDPIFVSSFVLPLAIEPRQIFPRRRFDSRFLRQPVQKFLVTLSTVAPHDRTHRRVGFQRGRVHPHSLALQQPLISQHFQHPEDPDFGHGPGFYTQPRVGKKRETGVGASRLYPFFRGAESTFGKESE